MHTPNSDEIKWDTDPLRHSLQEPPTLNKQIVKRNENIMVGICIHLRDVLRTISFHEFF